MRRKHRRNPDRCPDRKQVWGTVISDALNSCPPPPPQVIQNNMKEHLELVYRGKFELVSDDTILHGYPITVRRKILR